MRKQLSVSVSMFLDRFFCKKIEDRAFSKKIFFRESIQILSKSNGRLNRLFVTAWLLLQIVESFDEFFSVKKFKLELFSTNLILFSSFFHHILKDMPENEPDFLLA